MKRFWIGAFFFLAGLVYAQSVQITPVQRLTDEQNKALESGDVRLTCGLPCAFSWGYNRRKLKGYHDAEMWDDLIYEVLNIGYEENIAYYYLGRSIESRGNLDAAEKYYKLGLVAKKCSGDGCGGIALPEELNKSILRVQGARSASRDLIEGVPSKLKTELKLPDGWEPKPLNENLRKMGVEFLATNKFIDAGVRYWTYSKAAVVNTDLFVKNTREAMTKSLKDAEYSEITSTKVNSKSAYRFEVTGGTPSGPVFTYLVTFVEGSDSLIRFDAFIAKNKYSDYKLYLTELANGLTSPDLSSGGNQTQASSVTNERKPPPQVEGVEKPYLTPPSTRRVALVIGNDSYRSVAKLENAREDAKTIASNLSSVGYQVTLKLDLNEKQMKAALRNFSAQVQGGDEVLFFFAGHGVQLGSTNFLLPIDIQGENEAQVRDEAIQLQRILDDMTERKAKFTLALIDACRDNPFKSSGRSIGGRGLAPTTAATGQMVIFSAGTGQQALDKLNGADRSKNGLFTRVFVQEMQKPNVSIDRVMKNVRNQVAELAKSVGHEQVPAIYDQVIGDFYFRVEK